jgi:ParB family transcriptional regulator, chromosome partitioning protein
MNQLMESIREVGIQVPLSVFAKDNRFVLLDGERRWRCAKRLNLAGVPVLVQPEPSPLENLLKMFNIHNVRTDWDLMPMALKLAEVRRMLEDDGRASSPQALAGVTGVTLPTVRRALELLELPQKYQDMLLREAEKPRDKQEITADLFVEITKARRVIERYQPEVFEAVSSVDFVDVMVDKYRSGVVNNVVRFRDVSKIARAERVGQDPDEVIPTLVRLVKEEDYSIEEAFEDSVESAYVVRDLSTRIAGLVERLGDVGHGRRLPRALRDELRSLRATIDELLGDG